MMILPRVPSPLDKGDKLRAYHMLRQMSERHELYLYCLSETHVPFDIREHLLQFSKEFFVFHSGRLKSAISACSCLFNDIPFQAGYFYHQLFSTELKIAAERIKPDVIFFQLIRTALYAPEIEHPNKVIDYMDAFSAGYERMSNKSVFPETFFYHIEAVRLKKFERKVFGYFKKHLIISEKDRQQLGGGMLNEMAVIANGVDTAYFQPVDSTCRYDLHFHGNMNYLPNVNCAEYLAKEVLPELKKRGISATLLISGAAPHKRVRKLADNDKIVITGWLDDVRTAYSASRIFIAPLQLGTGMQNKVMEAMAMGMPCILSGLAANALGLKHRQHALVGESVNEYCNYVAELLSNEHLRFSLGQNARNYAEENFVWHESIEKMEACILS